MDLDFNLEKEIEFLTLFDFHIKALGNSQHWVILDRSDNNKGFIKKKMYHLGDGTVAEVYHMKIYDRIITCDNIRLATDKNYTYSFEYHYCLNDDVTVYINLSDSPKLVIAKDHTTIGYIEVDNKSVRLGYRMFSSFDNINYLVLQELLYQDKDERFNDARGQKAYAYKMEYIPVNGPIEGQKFHYQCSVSECPDGSTNFINSFTHPNIISNNREDIKVDGTVKDAFVCHGDGLNAVKYFKKVIEGCYPFTKNIVDMMLDSLNIGKELNKMATENKYVLKI